MIKFNIIDVNSQLSVKHLPQDFSLDEASPLGVRRQHVAVAEWCVECVVGFCLHLQPAGSPRVQRELRGHRVLSIWIWESLPPPVVSVLTHCEHLFEIIHSNNEQNNNEEILFNVSLSLPVWKFNTFLRTYQTHSKWCKPRPHHHVYRYVFKGIFPANLALIKTEELLGTDFSCLEHKKITAAKADSTICNTALCMKW